MENQAVENPIIRIQENDFDMAAEYAALRDNTNQDGAIVLFTGLVREFNQDSCVSGMFLQHYPGMTEKVLSNIVCEAKSRWPLNKVTVIHRVGQLLPGDQIVFVGVTSAHREAAFNASQFIMDFLKTKAPFWKKETTPEGARWVEANHKDQKAQAHWA